MRSYFSKDELRCSHCGEYHFNDQTLARLNKVRSDVGSPMKVSSGYRCREYNNLKGYTQTHSTGQAVDIACSRVYAYKILESALKHGFTGIGISQKGDGRFIHLDDLTTGVRPTIWSY